MAEWGYNGSCGPSCWPGSYPQAGGQRQSPINIITKAVQYDPQLAASELNLCYDPKRSKSVKNNGKTFTVEIDACDHNLSGGPLNEKYQLVQFHAHWGSRDEVGAEHTIDGKQYAAEVHLVHWNKDKFPSVGEAIQCDRGIAVLGSFLKVGAAHPAFEQLVPSFKKVQKKNTSTAVEGGFDPSALLPANKRDYWTYEGSLTTPPCYESVTFILFKEPVEVSAEQLQVLREFQTCAEGETPGADGGKLADNYRPVMPLNGRVIKSSFKA